MSYTRAEINVTELEPHEQSLIAGHQLCKQKINGVPRYYRMSTGGLARVLPPGSASVIESMDTALLKYALNTHIRWVADREGGEQRVDVPHPIARHMLAADLNQMSHCLTNSPSNASGAGTIGRRECSTSFGTPSAYIEVTDLCHAP